MCSYSSSRNQDGTQAQDERCNSAILFFIFAMISAAAVYLHHIVSFRRCGCNGTTTAILERLFVTDTNDV